MGREANLIGRIISRMRYQKEWSQGDLVARMQVLGCPITRDVLANIETGRSPVTDRQIQFFSIVFKVGIHELFPKAEGITVFSRRFRGVADPVRDRANATARFDESTKSGAT